MSSENQIHVAVTPHPSVHQERLFRLRDVHPRVTVQFVTNPDELEAVLPNCDAAVTSFPVSPALLAAAPRLRWIQAMSAGVERMLSPELIASEVTLTASKGPLQGAMAEHVITLMLALARHLPSYLESRDSTRW